MEDRTVFIKPEDIDLDKRKNIIRDELKKLIGKPIKEEDIINRKRLKQKKFDRIKTRLKIARTSQRRNRV